MPAAHGAGRKGSKPIVDRTTLERLIEARGAKQPAALLRWLASGATRLVVAGAPVDGAPLPTALAGAIAEALRADRGRTVETPEGPVFIQVYNPPLRLIVVGAVHIAQALVPMAQLTGYAVTVVDPRRGFASDARFPAVDIRLDWPDEALAALVPDARSAVVTLTHDPKLDDPALDLALCSDAFYIAALGSRRTHAARLERLAALGHDAAVLGRIHGPAGLALGAVSPAEIALSVMAEMTKVLRQEPDA
jgi:xanthine dehydrogenase accessory factor